MEECVLDDFMPAYLWTSSSQERLGGFVIEGMDGVTLTMEDIYIIWTSDWYDWLGKKVTILGKKLVVSSLTLDHPVRHSTSQLSLEEK
ncbi:hypothetical protein K2173_013944 [Erythroxylum novogranatense]|uniref:Uncharacterized protein n=1 Tax=Erythroxylum novogranatense TaxID=1862640 RepID=A0AAV8SDA6_9ROSI|nr:hypothetical protein K2173_013944 [Erythroxylum novogranatense]